MAFVGVVSPTAGVAGAVAAWLGVGAGVAVALRRRGVEPATVCSALVVWPLLLPLLAPARAEVRIGPLAARIRATFVALEGALAHPSAAGVDWRGDLDGLRAALDAADERLGLVDRLLGDAGDDPDLRAEAGRLRAARDHAAAEIEAVLSGVAQLRLRIGLLALAGDSGGIAEHLRRLKARVAALDEVSRIAP